MDTTFAVAEVKGTAMSSMRPRTFLAVLSLTVFVLAACAPAEESTVEQAEQAEPAAADPEPTEEATEADDGDDRASEEPADPDPEPESAQEPAEEPEPSELEVTAYVVAFHWGYAIFDESGDELERLEVPQGATLELVAVNDHASEAIAQLPDPVSDAIDATDWHERADRAVEEGHIPDPQAEEGMSLSEAIDVAHGGQDTADHGLMVTGVGARTVLGSHASEPERLEFTVDEEGVYEFRCTEDCGFGHEYQRWEMLTVEA